MKPPELETPPIPETHAYLYEIFWDLWHRDGITWEDIYYYQILFELELSGEEINILRRLSNEASRWVSKKERPKPTPQKSHKRGSK